jgi:4-azaleucine resistance transporter AzlC
MTRVQVPRGSVDRGLLRAVAPIAVATGIVGVSFGAIAVAAGFSWWAAVLMSLLVSSGGSQFVAVGIVAAGGAPFAAVLAGLVLNARHLPFGLAVSDLLGTRLASRLFGSHIMFDESVAFALAQRDNGRAKAAYWTAGIVLYASWNVGSLIGVLAGSGMGDPAMFGVDAAFPAGIFALLLPTLRDAESRRVALLAAVLALAATPYLPPGGPVLVALLGLLAALLPVRRRTEAQQ